MNEREAQEAQELYEHAHQAVRSEIDDIEDFCNGLRRIEGLDKREMEFVSSIEQQMYDLTTLLKKVRADERVLQDLDSPSVNVTMMERGLNGLRSDINRFDSKAQRIHDLIQNFSETGIDSSELDRQVRNVDKSLVGHAEAVRETVESLSAHAAEDRSEYDCSNDYASGSCAHPDNQ